MMTVRQIERLWTAKFYWKLLAELLPLRPEGFFHQRLMQGNPAILAAPLAMIRLDEFNQSHVPLFATLIRTLIAAQESDGGWLDAVTTAVCIRALTIDDGNGLVVDKARRYLANLQQDQGIWPAIPIRRSQADAYGSAFILFELGDNADFRESVRFSDAINWFARHELELDDEARAAWDRAQLRCRPASFTARGREMDSNSTLFEPALV